MIIVRLRVLFDKIMLDPCLNPIDCTLLWDCYHFLVNERSSADSLFRKGNAQLYPFHFEIVPGSATGSNTGSAAGNVQIFVLLRLLTSLCEIMMVYTVHFTLPLRNKLSAEDHSFGQSFHGSFKVMSTIYLASLPRIQAFIKKAQSCH